MKRSRQLALVAMAQVPLLLAGCGEEEKLRNGFYTSVEACRSDGNSEEVCAKAMQAAAQAHASEGPHFASREALLVCLPTKEGDTSNALHLHIMRLRRRIAPLGLVIKTLWNQGYQLGPATS